MGGVVCGFAVATPRSVAGAIGVVSLFGEIDAAFARLGVSPVGVGEARLRDLAGVDRGVVARWGDRRADLMPHGGTAVIRRLAAALLDAGLTEGWPADAASVFPEAADEIEARALRALATAASPLAVDLLLDQPRRWRENAGGGLADAVVLGRLLEPPLVVAVGPANVGKSTLLNALAGRGVSIVADEPGTTRDHVGALLDLGGLVVRYADTPGMRPSEDRAMPEREAAAIADRVIASADLVLLCGDAGSEPPDAVAARPAAGTLRVALRADLGLASWPHEVAVSAAEGESVARLAAAVRGRLVSEAAIADPRPWRFWGSGSSGD